MFWMTSSNPSVQSELRFETSGHEITPKEKANVLQQRFNQLEPKQSDEPSFRSSRPAPQEITPQQKAEILQKQRTEPKEKAYEHQPDGSASTNYDTAIKPQYECTTQKGGDHHALQQAEQQSHSVENNQRLFRSDQRPVQKTNAAGQRSVSSVKQGAKGTVKTTEKSVKTAERSVKTAEKSVKTAEKSARRQQRRLKERRRLRKKLPSKRQKPQKRRQK